MAKAFRDERAARGLIVPPNQTIAAGGGAAHSYLPLARQHGAAGLLPSGALAGHLGATADFDAPQPPVEIAEPRFDAATSAMPQPQSALEPGKGTLPVDLCDVKAQGQQFGPGLNVVRPPACSGSD